MIRAGEGSILDSGCRAIVNPANCLGAMGAGLAKSINEAYPERTRLYELTCKTGLLRPGQVVVDAVHNHPFREYIFHIATKDDWHYPSKIEWVRAGLEEMKFMMMDRDVDSIAIPALGCGKGKLDWADVRLLMWQSLRHFRLRDRDVEIEVFPHR